VPPHPPAAGTAEFRHRLTDLPNVYGTHHIGASTDQAQQAIAVETVAIIRQFMDTGRVPNVVNLASQTPATHIMVRIRARLVQRRRWMRRPSPESMILLCRHGRARPHRPGGPSLAPDHRPSAADRPSRTARSSRMVRSPIPDGCALCAYLRDARRASVVGSSPSR
jgi:hypothetical protein